MIKKFKKYNKMNETRESREEQLVNSILDRVSKVGYKNISNHEKEILSVASSEGDYGVSRYIDKSDDAVLTYDKLGHILINGMPYTEWSQKQEKEKSKPKKKVGGWISTPKDSSGDNVPKPDYDIRIYKNNDSKKLYYYIFWKDNEDVPVQMRGKIQKWISIDDTDPFGKILGTGKKAWRNKTMDEIHQSDLINDYDQFKDLSLKELNDFETFLKLRKQFRGHELNDIKDDPKQTKINRNLLKELKDLYTKFSNV